MTRPQVLVWAHMGEGKSGGTQTVIAGLAQGFRALGDPGVDLVWFTKAGDDAWLRPHLPEGSRVVHAADLGLRDRGVGFAWRRIGRASEMAGITSTWIPEKYSRGGSVRPTPVDADLVHFTTQGTFYTELPFIYQPHDLQHEHYPEYFNRSAVAARRLNYAANIRSAAVTVVGSQFIADDVARVYPRRAGSVAVVPLAPVELSEGRREAPEPWRRTLPPEFALYPAAAWPHKNHATLFRALRVLKKRGKARHLVLTGAASGRVNLRTLAEENGVDDCVTHLGFVEPSALLHLYRRAKLVTIPTLFEAGSFPMFEAFANGCPVVASSVCSLPAQADGAAILVDPSDAAELAQAIDTVWGDPLLREDLVARGRARAASFTWQATAAGFAASYRRALGLRPTPDDEIWERSHARF